LVTDVPVAVTVRLELPALALVPRVRVSVETPLPGEETVCGLKLAVTPAGNPDTDRAAAELNPPKAAVVNFTVPFALEVTVTLVAPAVSEKPATFTVRVCFCVTPPPTAVTVTE
jgi:hypothetical protein